MKVSPEAGGEGERGRGEQEVGAGGGGREKEMAARGPSRNGGKSPVFRSVLPTEEEGERFRPLHWLFQSPWRAAPAGLWILR